MENNNLDLTLGLNLGNYFFKVVGDMGKDMFKSSARKIAAGELVSVEQALKDDATIIEVNGQLYEMMKADSIPAHIQERNPEILQVLIAYSIARHTKLKKGCSKYNNFNIKMAAGLPLLEYMEKDNRNYIKDKFNGTFSVRYLGKSFVITIPRKNVHVVAEGYVYYQTNYAKYKEIEHLVLVDLGSRTIDSCEIIDGKPRNPKTDEYTGTLSLLEDLRMATGRKDLSEKKVETLLRTGQTKIKGTVLQLKDYTTVIEDYVAKVISYLKKTHKDIINADEIVFFGGGAYLLAPYLKGEKQLSFKLFDDGVVINVLNNAEYVNAEAYYMYALNA